MEVNSRRLNILTIDDENAIRSAVNLILSRRNCNVHPAQDASEAVQALKAQSFDLVLLDVKLGATNGIDLLKAMREELKVDVPVLLMSGLADTERIKEASKYQIKGFLVKPFNAKTLEEKVLGAVKLAA